MHFWPHIAIALAITVVSIHLTFVAWVIFGAALTRGRRWLTATHILCGIYGVIIEMAPWPCPLTLAEYWLEVQGGRRPFSGPFLLHLLDSVLYPDVPAMLLVWAAAAVLGINVLVYARRWRRWRAARRSGLEPERARG